MSSRYKPRGWFGEPHRHYLAAKGIKSRYNAQKTPLVPGLFVKMFSIAASADPQKAAKAGKEQQLFSNKYFVRNELKGNRSSSALHSAYAKGWTKDELRADRSAREKFGVTLAELEGKSEDKLPDSRSIAQEQAQSFQTLAEPDIPTIEQDLQRPAVEESFSQPALEESFSQPAVEESVMQEPSEPVSQNIATPGVPMRSRLSEEL